MDRISVVRNIIIFLIGCCIVGAYTMNKEHPWKPETIATAEIQEMINPFRMKAAEYLDQQNCTFFEALTYAEQFVGHHLQVFRVTVGVEKDETIYKDGKRVLFLYIGILHWMDSINLPSMHHHVGIHDKDRKNEAVFIGALNSHY